MKVRKYWLEIDPETGNPTGRACWAYFKSDIPIEGHWIRVVEVIKDEDEIEST